MPRGTRPTTTISYAVAPGSQWWAYARHSPGPNQSIASQQRAIAEFAADAGATITRWFIDEAKSGGTFDRDAFADMVAAAGIMRDDPPKPPVAGILILNFARFGRDDELVRFYLGGFRRRGWQVVSIQDRDAIPEGVYAPIFETLIHWRNRQYLDDITRETKRGLRQVVSQQVTLPDGRVVTGFSGGGFPPVGYRAQRVETGRRKNGEPRFNSYWVPDETPDQFDETPWTRVRRAWAMLATGQATYPDVQASCHLFRSLNSYNDFYRRRTYLGERVCGDLVVPGAHPAAVSLEDFARVQRLLDGRLRPIVSGRQVTPVHLLPGLLSCGYCGGPVVVERGSYLCHIQKRDRAACPHALRTPIRLVEDAVLTAVAERVLTGVGMQAYLEAADVERWQGAEAARAELARDARRLARLEEGITRLVDELEAGTASRTVLARLPEREREAAALRQDLEARRAALADATVGVARRADLLRVVAELRETLEGGTPAEQRAVLRAVLVTVKLYADQVELVCRMPMPPIAGERADSRGTPSGVIRLSACSAPLERSRLRNFDRHSRRQLRHRILNSKGEVKLFGRQRYVSSALAGQRVLVRVSDDLATIYAGETVVVKRLWERSP